MQCTNCGAELQLGATVCPVCEQRVVPTKKSVAPPRKRAAGPAARTTAARSAAVSPKPVSPKAAAPKPVSPKAAAPKPVSPKAAAPKPAASAPAAPAEKPAAPVAAKAASRPASRPAAKRVASASSAPPAAAISAPRAFPAAALRAITGAFGWVRSKFAKPGRPSWLIPVVIAVVVVVVAGAGWLVSSGFTAGANTPEAAALRMMQAYGNYDAAALIANSTHSSLTPASQAALVQQYAAAKATAKGPAIKNVAITKVTVDPKDPTSATVKVSEQALDPNTGKYSGRTDTLSLVEQNGRWLVRLF